MKRFDWFMVIAFVMILQTVSCAAQATRKVPELRNPLRSRLAESFDWTIRDAEVKAFLAAASPAGIPNDLALETIMLAELANAEKRDVLIKVWDRLWVNSEKIKQLLAQSDQRHSYPHSLAIIYYLLSAVPEPTWQRKSAQRLYQESLSNISSLQLSGYALHFYCQGLLLNGKFEQVMPFIQRLEHFTPQVVQAKNLHWIVKSAIERQRFDMADHYFSRLTAYMEQTNNDKIHAECRKASALIMEAVPKKALQISRQKVAHHYPDLYKNYRPVMPDRTKSQDAASVNRRQSAAIEVRVIQAGRKTSYVDPRLADIISDLKSNLQFSSFLQIRSDEIVLKQGIPFTMELAGQETLTMVLEAVTAMRARIGLQINQIDRPLFATTIEAVDHGTSIIGGPVTDQGMVVVWIRAKV